MSLKQLLMEKELEDQLRYLGDEHLVDAVVSTMDQRIWDLCGIETNVVKRLFAARLLNDRFDFDYLNIPVKGSYVAGNTVYTEIPKISYLKPDKPVGTVFTRKGLDADEYFVYVGEGFVNMIDDVFYGSLLLPYCPVEPDVYLQKLDSGELLSDRNITEVVIYSAGCKATEISVDSTIVQEVKRIYDDWHISYNALPGDTRIVGDEGISLEVYDILIEYIKTHEHLYSSADYLIKHACESKEEKERRYNVEFKLYTQIDKIFDELVKTNSNLLSGGVVALDSTMDAHAEFYVPLRFYFEVLKSFSAVDIELTASEEYRDLEFIAVTPEDIKQLVNTKVIAGVGMCFSKVYIEFFLKALRKNNIPLYCAYKRLI